MAETQLDEAALLNDGDDAGVDRIYTDELNEDELLGLTNTATKPANGDNADTKPPPSTAALNTSQPEEELDYEEDVEDQKPKEKFSSERKPPQDPAPSSKTTAAVEQKPPTTGVKLFVNPRFRDRLPNVPINGVRMQSAPLPSLLSQTVPPPIASAPMGPAPMMPPAVNVNAVLMNSLRPIVPPGGPMVRPMGQPMQNISIPNMSGGPPPGMMQPPTSMPPTSGPPPVIRAQIGQLPTVIQHQEDGTITFRTTIPPPAQPVRVTEVRAGFTSDQGGGGPSASKDWEKMVEDFISKGPEKRLKRNRRSRSRSSRSRSYSSGSYSDSYTDDSASSYSRSPSPRRHRRRHRSPSRKRSRGHYRNDSRRRHRYERPRRRSSRSPRRRRNSKEDEMKSTLECAESLGLDPDYLKKIEEQKRMREEVARKKYQREHSSRNEDSQKSSSRRAEAASSSRSSRRTEDDRSRSKTTSVVDAKPTSQQPSVTASPADVSNAESKLKPYLVVVIRNLGNLSDAYKRMKMTASAVGPTKKVWQTSDDSVSIIFENHEDAKTFMLSYHMKLFNGITLNIGLEKVFLNLASIP